MNTETLLERVRTARAEWDAALARLGDDRMCEPGVCGEWSAKDVIAHVTWFERQMIVLVRAKALAGSDLWGLGPEKRNDAIYREVKDLPLAAVRAEADRAFAELVPALESLTDEDLTDPGRFPGMPPDWQPWSIIAQNTWEHYEAHLPAILAWADR